MMGVSWSCRACVGLLVTLALGACGGGSGGGGDGADGVGSRTTLAGTCLEPGQTGDGTPTAMPSLADAGGSPHPDDAGKAAEHEAALALVDYEQATHVAVSAGAWCNPATWHNRTVPGSGARVVIPAGHRVQYGQVADAALATVRVDGELTFATDRDSRLVLDTLVVDPDGTLTIGTEAEPVQPEVGVEIVIADNGDLDPAQDPMLLGRGVISHGTTRIHGADKTSHLQVATDPMAGDTTLLLEETPENWRVGDTVVIAGTKFSGWRWDNDIRAVRYFEPEDEVRTIEAIGGASVTLDAPLEHDHFTPRSDLETWVANYTRNVTFRSENGASLPPHRRGHVMFMHTRDVDVRYAAFWHLGRTDKSRDSVRVEDLDSVAADSNIRGRYSLHLHRSGIDAPREPSIVLGNAVFGSPGLGYVHHDSHADFYDNAAYDTHGAAFVAESGNETGKWVRNIAIKAKGNGSGNPKNKEHVEAGDIGRTGTGFWFRGRVVAAIDNVAASVTQGFVYLHRGPGKGLPPERFMLPEALGRDETAGTAEVPIRRFDGNEVFASDIGVIVVKANPRQGHNIYTVMSDFTAWEVQKGAHMEYTAHYLLRDFDLVGATRQPFREAQEGILFGTNTTDMVVREPKIRRFAEGIHLGKDHTSSGPVGKDQYVVIGASYDNVDQHLGEYDATIDTIMATGELVPGRFAVAYHGMPDPVDVVVNLEESQCHQSGHGKVYRGTKTDAIGDSPIPSGSDLLCLDETELEAILETDGYYETPGGETYVIVEQYFSDRATGRIHKVAHKTQITGQSLLDKLGEPWWRYESAFKAGTLDLSSEPPTAADDAFTVDRNGEKVLALVANDSDPEGDSLAIDGVVRPDHGEVHTNDDGTVTYRPDLGFTGTDRFYYWVTDGQGNLDVADVTVQVGGD